MNMHAVFGNKTTPRVRLAVPADLPQLIELGRDLHAENALMPLDEAKITEVVKNGILGKGGRIGVIGAIGAIEGGIHLVFGTFWYSNELHLEELYSYVRPEFRRSGNAKALIEFAKVCAKQMNLPLLIGVVSNQRTQHKIRLYRRRLGDPAGAYFLFNGKTGHGRFSHNDLDTDNLA